MPPDEEIMPLLHRDDLSPEDLARIKAQFPDSRLICVGDVPDGQLPEEVSRIIDQIKEKSKRSVAEGRCIDCDIQMPAWPPENFDDWDLPEDWRYFTDHSGQVRAFQCPECDAAEDHEPHRLVVINPEDDD